MVGETDLQTAEASLLEVADFEGATVAEAFRTAKVHRARHRAKPGQQGTKIIQEQVTSPDDECYCGMGCERIKNLFR